jgi:hypothetical protein
MRITKTAVQIGLFVVGVACLYAGKQTRNNLLSSLGLVCFGLVLLIAGISLIVRKRLEFQLKKGDIGPHEIYTGLSAQLWGVYFSLLGILMMAFGVAYGLYRGGPEKFWADLLGTRLGVGFVLFLIGLMIAIDGVIRLLAGTAGHNVVLPANVGNCLERAGGAIITLFGMALIGCGVVIVLAPGIFDRMLHTILSGL